MKPADAPRSYIVEGQSGMLRRHLSHLRAVPSQTREIRDCKQSDQGGQTTKTKAKVKTKVDSQD